MKNHRLALLLVIAASPAWAINKCTGPDGKLSFQDAPCASSARSEAVKVDPAGGMQPSPSELAWQRELNRALLRGEPLVGMSEADLQRAMGAPRKTQSGQVQGLPQNQYVFERQGRSWHVLTSDGRVSSFRSELRAADAAAAPAPAAEPCPSPLAFRNLETSASSTTRREPERRELQRQVREIRRRCGY